MSALSTPHARGRATEGSQVWLPSVVAVAAAVQVAAGLLLVLANGQAVRLFIAELTAAVMVAALSFTAVGVLVIRRHPRHLVGWLFCVAGLGNAFFAWSSEYARFALVTRPGSVPGGETVFWFNLWAWVPVQATVVVLLPLLFPSGHLPSRRWRPVAALGIASSLLLGASLAFSPNTDSFLPQVENPYVLPGAERLLAVMQHLANAGPLLTVAVAIVGLVRRYRRSRGTERAQLQWLGLGAVGLSVGFVAASASFLFSVGPSDGLLSAVVLLVALPLLPAATGVAILRHRLYDIDLIVNRSSSTRC